MNVIAVDDEEISLECLGVVLENIDVIKNVNCFSSAEPVLAHIKSNKPDIAFLDIEMSGMNGLELAAKIKSKCPSCKIIFVTSSPKYAVNAFALHANGYLVKPVNKAQILKEVEYLKESVSFEKKENPPEKIQHEKLKVRTFGNFEVFVNGQPLKFLRSKSKELFAYLVDRKGANCSVGELCAVLWEDKTDDEALQSQLRKIISDLRKTLSDAGFDDVLTKTRGFIAVNPERLDCDYYRFLERDVDAVNSFAGEYMMQYSWSEFTVGYLESSKIK